MRDERLLPTVGRKEGVLQASSSKVNRCAFVRQKLRRVLLLRDFKGVLLSWKVNTYDRRWTS